MPQWRVGNGHITGRSVEVHRLPDKASGIGGQSALGSAVVTAKNVREISIAWPPPQQARWRGHTIGSTRELKCTRSEQYEQAAKSDLKRRPAPKPVFELTRDERLIHFGFEYWLSPAKIPHPVYHA